MKRLPIAVTVCAALVAVAPAAAEQPPPPPMVLPGDARVSALQTDPGSWLIGARPSAIATRLARRAQGRRILPGAYEVPRAAARPLARRLRRQGLLTFAEPNRYSSFRQSARAVPDDPLTPRSRWRDASIDPALAPPPVTPTSPLLALVDAQADIRHPEFADGNATTATGREVKSSHGTETMGIAVAPANGVGIVGAYPGARAVNVGLPPVRIRCSDSAGGIKKAITSGAAVINMSYGSAGFCATEYLALQLATRRGITLVAAGGNERDQGNPYEFPASLPHVLTIGALTPDDQSAFFSNSSAALDLVAPGVGLIAPLPPSLDSNDRSPDGYELVSGTSFAAPIVAAAAIWVRTVRPDLTVDQVAQVIRLSATDITKKGYDVETGWGKLNLAAALSDPPPIADPLEPNEDIGFVDGRAFGKPAAPIFRGGRPARLTALVDLFEDPGDVYRIRVPARRSVTIAVKPRFGDPDLELYAGGTRRIGNRGLIGRSRHTGERTDRVRIRNRGSRTRTALVRVFVRAGRRSLDSRYDLTVK